MPAAGTTARRQGERRWGRPSGEPWRALRPARQGGPARHVYAWVFDQVEGGRPSSQSSPFLCSFFLFLLLKGDYVLSGTTRISVLSRLLQLCLEGPAEAWAPSTPSETSQSCCLCFRGFSFKENMVFGVFCLFFKDYFKGVLKNILSSSLKS